MQHPRVRMWVRGELVEQSLVWRCNKRGLYECHGLSWIATGCSNHNCWSQYQELREKQYTSKSTLKHSIQKNWVRLSCYRKDFQPRSSQFGPPTGLSFIYCRLLVLAVIEWINIVIRRTSNRRFTVGLPTGNSMHGNQCTFAYPGGWRFSLLDADASWPLWFLPTLQFLVSQTENSIGKFLLICIPRQQ